MAATFVKDIDLVQAARDELARGRLDPLSPMHRANVDDILSPTVALERTYALLLHVLEGAADSEEEVAAGHPVVDALLAVRDDPRLDRRKFAQGRFAPAVDRLPPPTTRADVSESLARYIQRNTAGQVWVEQTPFTHQPLGPATPAQRALLLVEMMREKGVLDV